MDGEAEFVSGEGKDTKVSTEASASISVGGKLVATSSAVTFIECADGVDESILSLMLAPVPAASATASAVVSDEIMVPDGLSVVDESFEGTGVTVSSDISFRRARRPFADNE